MLDFFAHLLKTTLTSWQSGNVYVRSAILFAGLCLGAGGIVFLATRSGIIYWQIGEPIAWLLIGLTGLVLFFLRAKEELQREEQTQEKLEKVEERAREHPDKPQLAWDLARTKLENYLDRNLAQLRSIFWLTSFVMVVGFAFVLYGLIKAYERPEILPVSVVGSISGVVISFIGGSFLLIYRSILTQTRRYVSVLERINAVGMAVQVLGSISDESKELRNQSTAILAKQLIGLYSISDESDDDEEIEPNGRAQRVKRRTRKKAAPPGAFEAEPGRP